MITEAQRLADVRAAWFAGRLRYKLHRHQREAYDRTWKQFRTGRIRRMLWRWSRRIGKTFTAQVFAVECCIRAANVRIAVAAPSGKHLEEFVHPAVQAICADAPQEFQPRWVERTSSYDFPNGSRIVLYGCDTDAKIDLMGRGPATHGIIFEEAGHIPDLQKARRVTSPQLLSTSHLPDAGWMLFVGTPPESSAHYFVTLCRAYKPEGREVHFTIYDGHYEPDRVLRFIEEEADGMPLEEYKKTEEYRREFLGALIGDPTRKILKRANEETLAAAVERYRKVTAQGRPLFYRSYAGMDVGWSPDWTYYLLAWWHHRARVLVIEKELFYRDGFKRDAFAADVKAAEEALLGPARRSRVLHGWEEPSRWSDYEAFLLNELAAQESLVFSPTAKDDRDTAIDNLDRMFYEGSSLGALAINPDGCPMLLQQMDAAIWNKGRTEFARNNVRAYGHYDGVAAAVYLARNVQRDEDPQPAGWGMPNPATSWIPEAEEPEDGDAGQWRGLLGVD